MPLNPVTHRQVVATLLAALRGLALGLCLLVTSGSAGWAVESADTGPDILLPDNGSTLDQRNDAALKAAADAAAQSLLNAPLSGTTTTPTVEQQAAANLAASSNPNIQITDRNPYCNQSFAAAFDDGQQRALTVQLSRDNEFFQYQIAGAFAANCVGQMVQYAQRLSQGVSSIYTVATAGSPIQAAVTLIASQILQAVFRQLVSNLENQICSITNQLTSAMDSVVQNAICIPSGSLQVGGLFNFNVNLNLPNLQCDGIAINPLQLTEIDPATGQPYSAAQGAYTSGIFAGGGTGNYSSGGGFGVPPQRTYGTGDSTDIYGDPDVLDEAGDTRGGNDVGVAGTVAGSTTYQCFDLNKAIANRNANADPYYVRGQNGYCARGVRLGLCAGGIKTFCNGGHGDAYQYGDDLVAAGYGVASSPYTPQPGDIIVVQPQAGHPVGHIQMYIGGGVWASDFKTTDMDGIKGTAQNYTIYRPKPNVNQNANGTCK